MNVIRLLGNQIRNAALPRSAFTDNIRKFGVLTNITSSLNKINIKPVIKSDLNLVPVNNNLVPNCGMKVRGKLKLKCKNCYFAMIDQRLHVFCNVYPRHKQALPQKKLNCRTILTHACMSKIRPY